MIQLAHMVQQAMDQYADSRPRDLLESPNWLTVRGRCKDVSIDLELRKQPTLAQRVDREYGKLADALRSAAVADTGRKIKDSIDLWDLWQEFRATLVCLSRFDHEIERQYKLKSRPGSKGKRGPDRLPLAEAWRYMTVVQEWATIQERNQKRRMEDRYRKVQLAEDHGITVKEVDRMLGWYARQVRELGFPKDPRMISKGELRQWFE